MADITVIVCTYNRCHSLPRTLESIVTSGLSCAHEWEVLVVDNNSQDRTREAVAEFGGRYPGRFRYLFEARQGLSQARNAGIRATDSPVVAFTDDDVVVDPLWLEKLTANLHSGAWVAAGGPVLPEWAVKPPSWLPAVGDHALAPLAMFNPGRAAGPLSEPPYGANMAFRRELFQRYGEFRVDLGRCGDGMLSNEDTEFGNRLLTGGERVRFEPLAIVHHPVQEKRIQKAYFRRWWFDKARSDERLGGPRRDSKWKVCGVPIGLFRQLIRWTFQFLFSIRPTKRFHCETKIWTVAGSISEVYRQQHAKSHV